MRYKITLSLALCFSLCCWRHQLHAQCSSASSSNGGSLTPTTSFQTVSGVSAGTYFTFTGDACSDYTFSLCAADGGSASWDTQITITDNSSGTTYYGYNDDFCSLQSNLTFSPPTTGTYRVNITQYSCQYSGGTGATLAYRQSGGMVTSGDFAVIQDATAPSVDCVDLTTATNNQRGCAWDYNSPLNFSSSFSYDFTVNLGSSDGGADGMAFVIQNDPSGLCVCGTAGGSLGAGGITNSLIIEIDTYLNTEDRDDGMAGTACSGGAEPDHLDIWLNGVVNPAGTCPSPAGARIIPAAVPLLSGGSNYNIENGLDHTLRISWNAGSNTITASIMNLGTTVTYGTVSHSFNPMTVFGTNTPYYGFTASTGGLSNDQSFCIPLDLLPINLTEFSAEAKGGTAELAWVTDAMSTADHFMVERSSDLVDWNTIGRVETVPVSGSSSNYLFIDELPRSKVHFYRLLLVDQNGTSSRSEIRKVSFDGFAPVIRIWPNPLNSEGILNFDITGAGDEAQLRLSDISGKLLANWQPSSQEGRLDLGALRLAPGMYFLTLQSNGKSVVKKIVIPGISG